MVGQADGAVVVPAGRQRDARAQRAQADLALQVRVRGRALHRVAARGRALRAHSISTPTSAKKAGYWPQIWGLGGRPLQGLSGWAVRAGRWEPAVRNMVAELGVHPERTCRLAWLGCHRGLPPTAPGAWDPARAQPDCGWWAPPASARGSPAEHAIKSEEGSPGWGTLGRSPLHCLLSRRHPGGR